MSVSENYVLSEGVISARCPSHTKEEWLAILQEKSRKQKKKLSWYQIKQDPMINHEEIRALLGCYAEFERDLYPERSVYDRSLLDPPRARKPVKKQPSSDEPISSTAAGTTVKRPKTPKAQAAPAESKTVDAGQGIEAALAAQTPRPKLVVVPPVSQSGTTKLPATLSVPVDGKNVHPRYQIVLGRINGEDAEEAIEPSEVQLYAKPTWFNQSDVKDLFTGRSERYRIIRIIVRHTQIDLLVNRYGGFEDVPQLIDQIKLVMKFRGQRPATYLAALYVHDSLDDCRDYIRFSRNPIDKTHMIVDAQHYLTAEE